MIRVSVQSTNLSVSVCPLYKYIHYIVTPTYIGHVHFNIHNTLSVLCALFIVLRVSLTTRTARAHTHTHTYTHTPCTHYSSLFADVVNCMQTDNLELKKLVYLYLMNYAKTQPDLAILAVNTFSKDCEDSNPLIRALAVRTMGCIRVDQDHWIPLWASQEVSQGEMIKTEGHAHTLTNSVHICHVCMYEFLSPNNRFLFYIGSWKSFFSLCIFEITATSLVSCNRTMTLMFARQLLCVWPNSMTSTTSWWRTKGFWTYSRTFSLTLLLWL